MRFFQCLEQRCEKVRNGTKVSEFFLNNLRYPYHILIHRSVVYVSDWDSSKVSMFSLNGTLLKEATSNWTKPMGIDKHPTKPLILVSDWTSPGLLWESDLSLRVQGVTVLDQFPADPYGIAYTPSGSVWVAFGIEGPYLVQPENQTEYCRVNIPSYLVKTTINNTVIFAKKVYLGKDALVEYTMDGTVEIREFIPSECPIIGGVAVSGTNGMIYAGCSDGLRGLMSWRSDGTYIGRILQGEVEKTTSLDLQGSLMAVLQSDRKVKVFCL